MWLFFLKIIENNINFYKKLEENEDKVNELLDNLDINTYEKNYVECV